jgi:rhodanese-related sulfurtransferase
MAIRNITPAEVQARIARGEAVDLIDVRTTMEWNGGHAVGARHAPLSGLDPAAVVGQRVGKPDEPIYVICASGGRWPWCFCREADWSWFKGELNAESPYPEWLL